MAGSGRGSMTRSVMPKNVEIHGGSVRIVFYHQGKRCRESLGIAPTAANIAAAGARLRKLEKAIVRGTFVYEAEFPDSLRVRRAATAEKAAQRTFEQACESYLKTLSSRTPATISQYTNAIKVWKRLLGADTPVADLTHGRVAEAIGGHPWAGAKLKNNYMIPLRGLFRMEFPGRLAAENPMIGIDNSAVVKKRPDPLSTDERDDILADMRKRYDPRVAAYFSWMFATGMRPQEAIALRWEDIDRRLGIAHVRRVRTFKGSERDGSKTNTERDVLLTPAALDALAVMKPYTQLKSADIFENPITGQPWHDDRAQRDTYWAPTLKRLGIRTRRAYATRHTCATAALMAGVNPAFMAAQLGHSQRMFLDTYSRWVTGRHDAAQLEILARASAPGAAPKTPDGAAAPSAAPFTAPMERSSS